MTTIIVLEPHALLRLGILRILSDLEHNVVLEGGDYTHLARETPEAPKADLVLLSVPSSEAAAGLITGTRRAYAPHSIILISASHQLPALQTGLPDCVAGYVSHNTAPEVLQATVRLVLAGGRCFPLMEAPEKLTPSLDAGATRSQIEAAPAELDPDGDILLESEMLGLTPRQYEVLVLLARGYPMKMVGRRLNISVATAKAHTETLYQRLDVHNRSAAVHTAISRGAKLGWSLVPPPAALSGAGLRTAAS